MYNDSLQATIDANTLAINALNSQLEAIKLSVKEKDASIQDIFKHFILADDRIQTLPGKIYNTLKSQLSESLIRLTWTDYNNSERTNSMDIYYRSNQHYENRNTDNHFWEISCSSNKLIAHSTKDGWLKQDGEDIDKAKMQLIVFEFISYNTMKLIEYHNMFNENIDRLYAIQGAISNLERGIKDAEVQMERNRMIRMFKPSGETGVCRFNTDIVPAMRTGFYKTRRNYIGFDVIRLIKEGKKGIQTEFITINKNNDGVETNRYVSDKKWMTLNQLINLFTEAEREFAKVEKRKAEKAQRELEAHLDNATKETVNV